MLEALFDIRAMVSEIHDARDCEIDEDDDGEEEEEEDT